MTGSVPPARQCTLASCTEEKIDPTETGGLCETHHSTISGDTRPEEPDTEDANPGCDVGGSAPTPEEARLAFGARLRDAGVDTKRFIDVHNGEKRSTDHTQYDPDADGLRGNYGVYGGSGAGDVDGWELVDIDVDDYDGERAPEWIPETFTIASPHTDGDAGGHFYVAVPAGTADAIEDAVGTANPAPEWGEVRIHNQYCVGPGSQLDGCSKDWCDECATEDGGYYRIKYGKPIARMGTAEFVEEIEDDMPYRPGGDERDPSAAFEDFDLDEYEPTATSADDVTDDIRDVFAALDALDARHVAADTIVHSWNDSATTSGENRAFRPVWGPDANGTANIVDSRIWQDTGGTGYGGPVVMALIDVGGIDHDNATPRVSGGLWWKGIERLRELGYPIPKYASSNNDPLPTAVDVTLDPAVAWRAASVVSPRNLDPELPLETTGGGEAWIDPLTGEPVRDVARAVGVADGELHRSDQDLAGDTYHRLYHRARDAYGAPLPEYFDLAEATDRWDVVRAAIGALDFFDLDRDALKSTVTGEGEDVDSEAVLTLDPVWRPSESGESVIVFDSGAVFDGDTDTTIDPLRFVALEHELMDSPDDGLEGEAFHEAYAVAREEYRAPLPVWRVGTPDVTAVLPLAEDLVDAPTTDSDDDLEDARGAVEDLYRELAGSAEWAHLLNVLPGLGKTMAALKTATDIPTTYLAARKELMTAAAGTADEWGVTWRYLPIFSDATPDDETVQEAVAFVREEGMNTLRNPWLLLNGVDGPVFPEEDEEDGDEVDLNRPTCSCAEGVHGDAWALAVHVARKLDYTPRDIHELAHGLFGRELPCQEDGECAYSAGWDAVSDPDDPVDLLIGHYVHAHVQSARTYYLRDARGERTTRPRVVVLDEFPGDVYARNFGPEFMRHVTWLASALHPDVEDRQDLYEVDLWGDEWVRAWLRGEGDEYAPVEPLIEAVRNRRRGLHAAETATKILDEYTELVDDWGLKSALREIGEGGVGQGSGLAELVETLESGLAGVPPDTSGYAIANWIREDVHAPLASIDSAETYDLDEMPVSGELRGFVTDSLTKADDREDGAEGALEGVEQALTGGDDGARALAVYADDGYAHRLAHRLLEGFVTPGGGGGPARNIPTDSFVYGGDAEDGTTLKYTTAEDGTVVLVDREHEGATVHDTPVRTTADGEDVPLIGLDATGREELWSLAIGHDVVPTDIHDTPPERARFLRDVMGLQVVKAGDRVRSYEGNPRGKDLDGDVALVERIQEELAGAHGAADPDRDTVTVGNPAVITTKCVRNVLEDDGRLAGRVAEWENYGNVTGSNALGEHNLAAVLGTQHFGDHAVEFFSALAGETVTRTGRGRTLEYGNDVADAYLEHMREDQTMQAILRFTRGGTGAIVFARTCALRDDLPVLAEGHVINSWNETANAVARAFRRFRGRRFTVADVADAVDVTKRQVRRILDEFTGLGYIIQHDTGAGLANEYTSTADPGAGEVDVPTDELAPVAVPDPDEAPLTEYYTVNVRVHGVEHGVERLRASRSTVLPPPEVTVEDDQPD